MKRNKLSIFLSTLVLMFFALSGFAQVFNGTTGPVPTVGTSGNATFTADVAVDCDGGSIVGEHVEISNVTISNMTHTFDGDLDISIIAPSGEIMLLSGGNGGSGDNYIGTVFANGNPCIESGGAPYTGTWEPEGGLTTNAEGDCTTNQVFATVFDGVDANGQWTLNIQDNFGGDSGNMNSWSIEFSQIDGACDGGGGGGGNVNCAISCPEPVVTATTDPGSDCSAFVTIPQPLVVGDCDLTTLTNDYNGGTDASDEYPLGETEVTYTLTANDGSTVTCTVLVVVEDNTPPTFICPGDLTINLDPGACSAVFDFNVQAFDECNTQEFGLNQNTDVEDLCEDGTFLGGIVCTLFGTDVVGYGRLFDLQALNITTDFNVTSIDFAYVSTNGAPITVNFYALDPSITVPTFANVGAPVYTEVLAPPTAFAFTCNNFTLSGTPIIPAGMNMFFTAEAASNGFGGTIFSFDSPAVGEDEPTYVYGCEASIPGLFTDYTDVNLFFNQGWNVQVNGETLDPEVPVIADPDNPYASGDDLPITADDEPHCFVYTAVDLEGNESTCEFCVTVLEYPEDLQITALACNDEIQVSLDETCSATITADMVLEGGPYGCYDTYTVTLADNWGFPVDADPSTPGAQVSDAEIGQDITVTVTDTDTGNSCWGILTVEDKLAPNITCMSYEVPCTADLTPGSSLDGAVLRAETSQASTDNQTVEETGNVSSNLAGTPVVTDVNVDIFTDHTWVGDLVITVVSPSGTSVELLNNLGGPGFGCNNAAGQNMDVLMDDEAAATYADMDAQCPPVGSFQPANPLSAFDGENPYGDWTVQVQDLVGGDGGTVDVTVLIATSGLEIPGAVADDNCGPISTNYQDEFGPETCDGDYGQIIYRHWTVTDAYGNSNACTDTFNITRATIADLTLPADYDGLNGNPGPIECDASYPADANGNPHPSLTGGPTDEDLCWNISGTYEDVVIPICGGDCGSFKILRQWTILDWCTGEIVNHNQIIKINDTTAPVISGEEEVEVSTDIWGCEYTLDLADLGISISDNCDADPDYIVIPPVGTELPKGLHLIRVQSQDCCANVSEFVVELTVLDLVPPIVVVDDEVHITLTSDGSGKAFAETFDEGSFDGCGPIDIEVRRTGANPCGLSTQWGPYVEFCCADVPISPVVVEFRATDHSGNRNTGWIDVTVEDKLPPAILCPPNIDMTCLEDYQVILDNSGVELSNLPAAVTEILGVPQFGAACPATVVYTAGGNINECGVGTINVTWLVTTDSGLSNGCVQRVFVSQEDENRLQCDDIVFPAGSIERITYGPFPWCEVNDGENDNDDDQPAVQITDCSDPSPTAPELDNDLLCTAIGISMTADTFNFAGGACKKIVVHWEVIDHCIFDENYVDPITGEIDPFNNDNGYFEFFAEYDVFDNEGPVVECIEEYVVNCTDNFVGPITANASDNCSDPAFFGWSWQLDAGNTGVINGTGVGSMITPGMVGLPFFPLGEHRVIWSVNDGCGNNTNQECVFTISQEDTKAPTPYCYDGLSTAVMQPPFGTVELWANDFVIEALDDCSDNVALSMIPEEMVEGLDADAAWNLSFTGGDVTFEGPGLSNIWATTWGYEFDCSYIPNGVSKIFEVRVYFTDESNNYDYCTATLRLDDNLDACEDDEGASRVAGEVRNEEGADIEAAEMTLESTHPEYPVFEGTDISGHYEFGSNPTGYDYTISGSRDFDYLNGVSTLDLVLIQKYILGLEDFDSAYKVIAADINNDENVSALDLVQLRKLILGLYPGDDLPNNESWKFVDAKQVFADINQPWPVQEQVSIVALDEDMMSENFVGVKIGDVNGSAETSNALGSVVRNGATMNLEVNEANVSVGSEYRLAFKSSDFDAVYGYQFTLNFAGMKYVGMESGALEMNESNFGLSRLNEGIITTSWSDVAGRSVSDDETLFTLVFVAETSGQLSEMISLNSRVTAAEAYRGTDLTESGLELVFRTDAGVVESNVIELYQNEPNPFGEITEIGFNLPEGGQATLTVYDVTGKVLKVINNEYSKGYHTERISKSDLNVSGVLYYQLESGEFTATKKMIILE